MRDDIYTKVMDVLLETGERVSIKMRSMDYYKKYSYSSFLSNVTKDGIVLND